MHYRQRNKGNDGRFFIKKQHKWEDSGATSLINWKKKLLPRENIILNKGKIKFLSNIKKLKEFITNYALHGIALSESGLRLVLNV